MKKFGYDDLSNLNPYDLSHVAAVNRMHREERVVYVRVSDSPSEPKKLDRGRVFRLGPPPGRSRETSQSGED